MQHSAASPQPHPTLSLQAGSYALNAAKGKKERIGRLMEMHANRWAAPSAA